VTLLVTAAIGLGAVLIGAVVVLPADETAGLVLIVSGSAMALGTGGVAVRRRGRDESGRAGLPLLVALVALALVPLVLALTGCGAMQVHAERDIDVDIDPGPPCVVVVRADGEIVSTTRGPKPCKIVVPPPAPTTAQPEN
jgi:hypothetical protein